MRSRVRVTGPVVGSSAAPGEERKLRRDELLKRGAAVGLAAGIFGGLDGLGGLSKEAAAALEGGSIVFADAGGGAYAQAWVTAINTPFTAATGITVNQDSGGGSLAQLRAMHAAGNVSVDIIELSCLDYLAALREGLLQPMPADTFATLKKVSIPGLVLDHAIASATGANGVIVSGATVKKHPMSPKQFFDPVGFPGTRAMSRGDIMTNLLLAQFAGGVPQNKAFPINETLAYKMLDKIKPHVAVWTTSSAQTQQLMLNKQVDMETINDGRYINLRDQHAVPLWATWRDANAAPYWLCVPSGAPNADGAFAYLKFYGTTPSAQGAWTTLTKYVTPNPKESRYITPAIKDDLWINPGFKKVVYVFDMNKAQQAFKNVDLNAFEQRWLNWVSS